VVWTLHDMNPFTGGCHHAADCEKFRACCGACPVLGSDAENDLSRRIWNRKRQAYDSAERGGLSFVAPSRWLASKAQESSLVGTSPVSVIPYGLDTGIFRPHERGPARDALGLAREAPIILFASYFSRDSYKGFSLLLEALKRIQPIPNLRAISVGAGESEDVQGSPVPIQSLGFIKEQERMALIYSAADLFVLPSLQDNFPNTALEALACGTPVVAFRVGGIPEIVRDDLTGITASSGDTEGLAKAIAGLLGDPAKRSRISSNCRHVAIGEYSLKIQAERYIDLYREMLRKK